QLPWTSTTVPRSAPAAPVSRTCIRRRVVVTSVRVTARSGTVVMVSSRSGPVPPGAPAATPASARGGGRDRPGRVTRPVWVRVLRAGGLRPGRRRRRGRGRRGGRCRRRAGGRHGPPGGRRRRRWDGPRRCRRRGG